MHEIIGALRTPTMFIVCFLQPSTSLSDMPAHAFHIGIDIEAIRFVFPTAHMRCWKSATKSSILLDDFIGTIGPLLVTIVFFVFSACEDWITSMESSSAFRFVVKISSLARTRWVSVPRLVSGHVIALDVSKFRASSLAIFKTTLTSWANNA